MEKFLLNEEERDIWGFQTLIKRSPMSVKYERRNKVEGIVRILRPEFDHVSIAN